MKKILTLATVAIISLSTASAQKENTIDTLQITTTPQMHCSGCENKIKSNIRFVKGVKKIETSLTDQKVTIIYDKKMSSYPNFEEAFKKIGYTIKNLKANN